jgi:MtN3 and saliva related transmembrane protein
MMPAMAMHDLLGYTAAFLTTASFVPQAWLTFRTRNVSGISLSMYSAFTLGVALWLVYGISLNAWPIVAANAITLTLALSILLMKLHYGRTSGPERGPETPPSA